MRIVTFLVLLLLAVPLVATFPLNPAEKKFSTKLGYLGQFSSDVPHNRTRRVRRSNDGGASTTSQPSQPTSFYFRSQNAASWSQAAFDCKAFLGPSATLLYIETQEELAKIIHLFESNDDSASYYWIGGKYNFEAGRFVWENGVEIDGWAPWKEGHPDTLTPVTSVAIFTVGSVKFFTQFNSETARYICELKSGSKI